jgi:hypothetical protein
MKDVYGETYRVHYTPRRADFKDQCALYGGVRRLMKKLGISKEEALRKIAKARHNNQ